MDGCGIQTEDVRDILGTIKRDCANGNRDEHAFLGPQKGMVPVVSQMYMLLFVPQKEMMPMLTQLCMPFWGPTEGDGASANTDVHAVIWATERDGANVNIAEHAILGPTEGDGCQWYHRCTCCCLGHRKI